MAEDLEKTHGVPVRKSLSFGEGHAAGMVALQQAEALLASGEVDQCFLGGVETVGERMTLEVLDMFEQTKSSRVPFGIIHGEAAAFLCVRRAREGAAAGATAVVGGAFVAPEAEQRPSLGTGLTNALAGALGNWGGDVSSISFLLCDLNGHRDRAKQMTFATMRALWSHGALPELHHPADRFGDVGAAAGPLLLAVGAERILRDPEARVGLVVCSSPGGIHGAAVVGRE